VLPALEPITDSSDTAFLSRSYKGTFDLGWSNRDSVAFLQHVVRCDRLTIDSNQITGCFATAATFEKCIDCCLWLDLYIVSESSAIVVNK